MKIHNPSTIKPKAGSLRLMSFEVMPIFTYISMPASPQLLALYLLKIQTELI